MPKFSAYMRGAKGDKGDQGETGQAAIWDGIVTSSTLLPTITNSNKNKNMAYYVGPLQDGLHLYTHIAGATVWVDQGSLQPGISTKVNTTVTTLNSASSATVIASVNQNSPSSSKVFNFDFGIPKGQAAGFAATQIAKISSLASNATPTISITSNNSNTAKQFTFNFGVPVGVPAGFGKPTITVTTLPEGSSVTASITTSGSETSKVFKFNFGFPKNVTGTIGELNEIDLTAAYIKKVLPISHGGTGESTSNNAANVLLTSLGDGADGYLQPTEEKRALKIITESSDTSKFVKRTIADFYQSLTTSDIVNALGYTPLKNTTDTLTGTLKIESPTQPRIQIKNESLDASSTTINEKYSIINFHDNQSNNIAFIQIKQVNGNSEFKFSTQHTNTNSTLKQNYLTIGEDTNGNAYITLSHPAAWREALGIDNYEQIISNNYLPLTGGVVTGTLNLSLTTDATAASSSKPALIIGTSTGTHLEIDNNEIMAKTNANTVGTLYLNNDGGLVKIGDGGLSINTPLGISSGGTGQSTSIDAANVLLTSLGDGTNGYLESTEEKRALKIITEAPGANKFVKRTIADFYKSLTTSDITAALGFTPANSSHTHNYLPLSGGTLTGSVTQQRTNTGRFYIKSTSTIIGVAPSEEIDLGLFGIIDNSSQSQSLSYIQGKHTTTNVIITKIAARNKNNAGSTVVNALELGMGPNNTRTVTVTSPTAWREALGIYSTTEINNMLSNISSGGTILPYLPLSGGTITGAVTFNANNGNWLNTFKGNAGAIYVKRKSISDSNWYSAFTIQTKQNGAWSIGTYNDQNLTIVYGTSTLVNGSSDGNSLKLSISPEGNFSGGAAKLSTARTITVDLASTVSANFDGTENVTPGIKNILPVSHGGTGKDSLTKNAILTGNNTTAIGMIATKSGALYATTANGAASFGILPTAQGGTGSSSLTTAVKNFTGDNLGTDSQYFLTITNNWERVGYASARNAGYTIINALTIATGDSKRDDYIITQYAGGTTTHTEYYRRALSNVFKALTTSDIITGLGYTPLKNTANAITTTLTYTPATNTHVHGSISNAGAITGTGIAIASGDKLVFIDSDDSSKLKASKISFGTSTDYVLSNKGTWVNIITPTSLNNYLPLSGGTVTGTLILSRETDAQGTANNKPALIVGNANQLHLELDGNELMAKATSTTIGTLYLNNNGGSVYIGSGGLQIAKPLGVAYGGTGVTTGTKNKFFATPNGSDGAPTFRSLVADDIPVLSATKITSGTFDAARIPTISLATKVSGMLPIANGGTGVKTASVNKIFAGPSSGSAAGAPTFRALVADDIPSLATSKITSGVLSVDRGGIGLTTATKNYVFATPSSANGAPTFRALVADDIPSLAASKITSGTFNIARIPTISLTTKVSGVLPIAQGGTGKTTAAEAWTALGGGSIGKLNALTKTLITTALGYTPIKPGDAIDFGAFSGGGLGKAKDIALLKMQVDTSSNTVYCPFINIQLGANQSWSIGRHYSSGLDFVYTDNTGYTNNSNYTVRLSSVANTESQVINYIFPGRASVTDIAVNSSLPTNTVYLVYEN